jgi:Predicted transcriptional regulators
MERSIQEVARLTGTTSRTLRHYDAIGLLTPTRTGTNGMRHYDADALVRLQRILLLRDLGLGLGEIREVLERRTDEVQALGAHLELLHSEQTRLARQVAAVEHTIDALEGREVIMAETMFDGFDHRQYEEEVRTRWGDAAWENSTTWWEGMDAVEQQAWKRDVEDLNAAWKDAAQDPDVAPGSPRAQELAARHIQWLASMPGTPAGGSPTVHCTGELGGKPGAGTSRDPALRSYVLGLAEMYVADPRFAENYGGRSGAEFVRAALRAHLGERSEAARS